MSGQQIYNAPWATTSFFNASISSYPVALFKCCPNCEKCTFARAVNSSARCRIVIAAFSVQCLIRCFTSSRLYVGRGGGAVEEAGSEVDVGGCSGGGESRFPSLESEALDSELKERDKVAESGSAGDGVGGFDRDARASSASCSSVAELTFGLDDEYAGGGAPKITVPSLSPSLGGFAESSFSCCCSSGYRGTCRLTDDPEKCRARRARGRARDNEVAALSIDEGSRRK